MVDTNLEATVIVKNANEIVRRFETDHPTQENVEVFYDGLDPAAYDQMNVNINSIEHYKIVEAVSEPRSDGESFGYLNLDKEARIFDVGAGTGILGKCLSEKGYHQVEGADASANFINYAANQGWYKGTE